MEKFEHFAILEHHTDLPIYELSVPYKNRWEPRKIERKKRNFHMEHSSLSTSTPTEFPFGFHRYHFIPPTTSSSAFVRILVHSQKLRVTATK
jgi:hypothetical protein